jgi:ABC-2 type transport system permease protein
MIRVVAGKEFLDLLRDGRFRLAGGAVLALLLVALGTGVQQYRALRQQQLDAARLTRTQWLAQGEKNPHSAAHYGIYAFKPQLPLSYVDRGVIPYLGTSTWLEAHRQNDFSFRPAQDAPALQRFGEMTVAVILQVLLPVLIIFFCFGQFAGERESGTLRQLLSTGITTRDLALGKIAGTGGALLLLLLPAAVLGAAALLLLSSAAASAMLSRFLLLAVVYASYFLMVALVALTVSAWARSSRQALVLLLGFWVLCSLIAPRLISDLSRRLYPAPSALEFQQRVDRDMALGLNGDSPAARRAAELEQRVLAQYGVTSIKDLPVNFDGIRLQEGEEHGNQVFDRHFGVLWQTFERQNRMHELAGVLAPLLALRSLSMALAGTDFDHHRHFAASAEQYRRMLVKAMNVDMIVNADSAGFAYQAGPEVWNRVPPFNYSSPDFTWVVARHVPALLALALWLLAAGLALRAGTRRLRVE